MEIRDAIKLTPFLLSDGGMSPRGKESWTIYFRNSDLAVIEEFRKTLSYCIKKSGAVQKRRDGTYMVKIHSKELGKELLKFSPSYRTSNCERYPACPVLYGKRGPCKICTYGKQKGDNYPPSHLPNLIFKNKKTAKYFLRIYTTCDGGVSVTSSKTKYPFLIRKVFIAVANHNLRNELSVLLKNLGFQPKVYSDQIRLTESSDIEKFSKEIRFIEHSKIGKDSKRLFGHEKNFILERVVRSYKKPKKMINFLVENMA
jgi:hypothetical protein